MVCCMTDGRWWRSGWLALYLSDLSDSSSVTVHQPAYRDSYWFIVQFSCLFIVVVAKLCWCYYCVCKVWCNSVNTTSNKMNYHHHTITNSSILQSFWLSMNKRRIVSNCRKSWFVSNLRVWIISSQTVSPSVDCQVV